jgi:transcription termination factor NusB
LVSTDNDVRANKSPEDARYGADIIVNVLRDPETSEKTPFAPAEMLRSIMLSAKKTATEEYQRRLIEHTEKYISSAVQQVLNRTKNIDLNIDTYLELQVN